MTKKYFRVSANWMLTYGFEDTYGQAKVFEVIRVKSTPSQFENIVVLKCPHTSSGEWLVYESRGHYVEPFTLVFADGLFMPAPADVEERGTDLKTYAEFDTFEAAQSQAIKMNEAIRLAYINSIPRAFVDDIPAGSFVRRMTKEGMPMAKTYRRDLFDSERQRFPLVDPVCPDKIIYVPSGTLVAIDDASIN